MIRTHKLACVLVLVCALATPVVAHAAVIGPDPSVTYSRTSSPGAVGKWGTMTATVYFNWPSAYSVRISKVRTTVKSTHALSHYIDWGRVRIINYGSTAYDRTCWTNHDIEWFGSGSCYQYPSVTVSAAGNSVGSSVRYVGAHGTPYEGVVVTPFYYVQAR